MITLPRKKTGLLGCLNRMGCSRTYGGHEWLFCFNVKCHTVDLSWDSLVRRCIETGYGESLHLKDPVWVAAAKKCYEEHEGYLFDWGVDDARRHFVGDTVRGPFSCKVTGAAWYADMLPDGDCFRQMQDGTPVDARFAFFGRGGGWLTLTMFNNVVLDSSCELEKQDYQWLRKLTAFLGDVRKSAADAQSWVEEAAAFSFFVNICDDCETTGSRMEEWLQDQSGEH